MSRCRNIGRIFATILWNHNMLVLKTKNTSKLSNLSKKTISGEKLFSLNLRSLCPFYFTENKLWTDQSKLARMYCALVLIGTINISYSLSLTIRTPREENKCSIQQNTLVLLANVQFQRWLFPMCFVSICRSLLIICERLYQIYVLHLDIFNYNHVRSYKAKLFVKCDSLENFTCQM